jgi:hypothetical protein
MVFLFGSIERCRRDLSHRFARDLSNGEVFVCHFFAFSVAKRLFFTFAVPNVPLVTHHSRQTGKRSQLFAGRWHTFPFQTGFHENVKSFTIALRRRHLRKEITK